MADSSLKKKEGVALPAPGDEEESLLWLALARVEGLGCSGFKRVADYFGDPRRALYASASELAQIPELDKRAVEGLLSFCGWDDARAEMRRIAAGGLRLVPFTDSIYPARLRMITDPPPFLYAAGDLKAVDETAVAVVGSRSASDYGVRMAQELCRGLAALGFTIVSGMARGIDAAAHEAALAAGGRTIAVLGSGADVVYPPEHAGLHRRIVAAGAVVSELPVGTAPLSFNFPSRNRIISGLSLGVVVVEATEKSGSLITAGLALDQGREVFAVPGQAGASRSRGTHRLIRQGAKLVETVEDIVEEISPQLLAAAPRNQKSRGPVLPPGMGPEVRRVFEMILGGPLHIDEVIQASGLSAGKVSEILLDLEIGGFLRQLPGKRFKGN